MICKVLSASLGYNGSIYTKGDNVEVSTPAEVKRLTGDGVIEAGPAEVPQNKEEPKLATPSKHLSSTRNIKGDRKRK